MAVAIFIGVAVVLVVLAIAGVAVLRESARMDAEPPTRWFDKAEAIDWVVQHLPDEWAATLTVDDVDLMIDVMLDEFDRRGVSSNGGDRESPTQAVVGASDLVQVIVSEAARRGVAFANEQVHAVIDTQFAYLRSIGVVGPPAEPGEAGSGRGAP